MELNPTDHTKEQVDEMTTKEIARLIEWLIAHGHTHAEACECIKYIAGK